MIATRVLRSATVALAIGLAIAGPAAAQSYPSRPIKLIVPFPAGGPPDALARLVAHQISSRLHQTGVIDNRPGPGATIRTRAAALAGPDGSTLLLASPTPPPIGPAL